MTALPTTNAESGTTNAPGAALRKEGLGYVYDLPALGVRLRADYLKERSDEVSAEVTAESTMPGVPPHLHQARMNLSVGTTRTQLAKHLASLTPKHQIEWGPVVEAFCVGVLRKERQGQPLVRVGRLPAPARTSDLIERLLPRSKPTLWYGPQGAGKGWMAAAACVCVEAGVPLAGLDVAAGRALYLDWEDNADTLNARVQALAAGLKLPDVPELAYRQCRKTLARDLNQLTRCADDAGADLIVVDSVGLAAGSGGERGSYEDVALAFFDALRQFEPATILCIDHVNGEALKDGKLAGKAFGSIYKMAEARCAWEIHADQETGTQETHLGFFHTKFNHTQKYPALGFCLVFEPAAHGAPPAWVLLDREDVRESAALGKNLSLAERLDGALNRGARSVKELAEAMEEPENKLRVVLNRHAQQKFTKLQDGRWARLQRDPADYLRPVPDDAGDAGEDQ